MSVKGIGERSENLSIMIPTYNCAAYLRETLLSLKAQGDWLAQAQIEVVDDVSTKDDPEAVIRDVWGERVTFTRNPQNLGLVGNFNTCLHRAERPWLQILHGDDYLFPGAVEEFHRCLTQEPETKAVFGRVVVVDAESRWEYLTDIYGPGFRGNFPYDPYFWEMNRPQFAGILLSREAMEAQGGFSDRFAHATDWDCWWRLARNNPVCYSNVVVGAYRVFAGNHSTMVKRNGNAIREYMRFVHQVLETEAKSGNPLDEKRFASAVCEYSMGICQLQYEAGDMEAYRANLEALQQAPTACQEMLSMRRMLIEGRRPEYLAARVRQILLSTAGARQ